MTGGHPTSGTQKQNKNCDEIPKVMPLIITLLLIAPLKKNHLKFELLVHKSVMSG